MKKTVRDIAVSGKRVLVRCDFNVPLKDGKITDDKRIRAALPTIQYLIDNDAKVILISHLGRPKGEYDPSASLAPVAKRLSELLGQKVEFFESKAVVDSSVREKVNAMKPKDVALLENVRFRKEETKNEETFSEELALIADIFVNDAFGTAHRAHSSTVGVTSFLPSVSGFLIEKELEFLGSSLDNPKKPFVAVLGGSKVSDKILLIERLMEKADSIIIGGGMAYTFLKAIGEPIGKSILDEASLGLAGDLLKKAEEKHIKILLPIDTVAASEFSNDADIKTVDEKDMPDDYMGLDIGPKTAKMFAEEIKNAKTVLWNGPMGVFEMKNFEAGTRAVAKAMQECGGITVIGGGDSAAAIAQFGMQEGITHISTGGGASLEYLEGKLLPGVAVLLDK